MSPVQSCVSSNISSNNEWSQEVRFIVTEPNACHEPNDGRRCCYSCYLPLSAWFQKQEVCSYAQRVCTCVFTTPGLCAAGGYGALHGSGGAGGPTESGEHRVLQTDRHLLHGPCALGDDVEVWSCWRSVHVQYTHHKHTCSVITCFGQWEVWHHVTHMPALPHRKKKQKCQPLRWLNSDNTCREFWPISTSLAGEVVMSSCLSSSVLTCGAVEACEVMCHGCNV